MSFSYVAVDLIQSFRTTAVNIADITKPINAITVNFMNDISHLKAHMGP